MTKSTLKKPSKESLKLTIELVPETCWFSNVRSKVLPSEWDTLRKACYAQAHYACEICGGRGNKWPVECHEVWEYDDDALTQTLKRLIALCPSCHEVKHIGFAQTRGREAEALAHFQKVNQCDSVEARHQVNKAFEVWEQRSKYRWRLDITWLETRLGWTKDSSTG